MFSCRPKENYEVIGLRENQSTFIATVYSPDTAWAEMENFAKSLVNQKKNKKFTDYSIGFYIDKNRTLKFAKDGTPIVKSYEEASHSQDFLIATYSINFNDLTTEKFVRISQKK